ncbi:MAG: hypothetical protein PGN11_12890 [Quadrisphaera sp.]
MTRCAGRTRPPSAALWRRRWSARRSWSRRGAGDVVIDTDGLDPGDVVAQLEALDARRPLGA